WTEINVEVLCGRMFYLKNRVIHGILNVSIWFGAVENLINRRVCVNETGTDFPFLAARHSAGSRSKDVADLIRRKRRIGIEKQSDNTSDVRRRHRCALDLCVERDVCRRKLGVGIESVRYQIAGRACRYNR